MLLAFCGDGMHRNGNRIDHVRFLTLSRHDKLFFPEQTAHFVRQGNSFCLRGHDGIHFPDLFRQFRRAGPDQFCIPEDHKTRESLIISDRDKWQSSFNIAKVQTIFFHR